MCVYIYNRVKCLISFPDWWPGNCLLVILYVMLLILRFSLFDWFKSVIWSIQFSFFISSTVTCCPHVWLWWFGYHTTTSCIRVVGGKNKVLLYFKCEEELAVSNLRCLKLLILSPGLDKNCLTDDSISFLVSWLNSRWFNESSPYALLANWRIQLNN
jgi:hypothetical protein